ncbi:AraC family transcriptional regulator [Phormidium tenue FACHB-886]|nr:AraC family transcriptional regulator [Phormidium tenue FACHB-886]
MLSVLFYGDQDKYREELFYGNQRFDEMPPLKFWQVPDLQGMELYQAQALCHRYSRHSHETFSIAVMEAGVSGSLYRGTTYYAPSATLVLMNPDEVHTCYSVNDQPFSYRMLYPPPTLMQQAAAETGKLGTIAFKQALVPDAALAKAIAHLHQTLEQPTERLRQESLCLELFSVLLHRYTEGRSTQQKISKEPVHVERIKDYLQANWSANVSLGDLVQLTQLNRAYLIRMFRQATGLPPHAYLTQVRLAQAKRLLSLGEPVAQVALAVGMADQSHLTRYFKQRYGITPGQFRRMSLFCKTDDLDCKDS